MKKILLSLFAFCLMSNAQAQSLDRSVVSSAGQVESTEKITLEWTLGESAIQSFSYEDGQITEGFHQPIISVLPPVERPDVPITSDARFIVFPNPTNAKVQIRANLDHAEEVHLSLYDVMGRQIIPVIKSIGLVDKSLDMEFYQAGAYLLIVRDQHDQVIHTARILKH